MLNLKLRDEFLGQQTPGTAISLRRSDNTGAAQQSPDRILDITYPTADIQMALRTLSSDRPAKPVVLLGDRGRGKSHIMAVMHHAVASPDVVEAWAHGWGSKLHSPTLQNLKLQRGYIAISESVHNQEYPLLWDLLFDRHPQGQLFRGRFQQMGQPYPPRTLLEEMFKTQPTVLILDEFQKWFDGLHDDDGQNGRRWRTVASNFIQNLSEISRDRPELLLLVVSVLNNKTDAFQQIYRDSPVIINFQSPSAKRDRQQLLLHRLFTNRANIPDSQIHSLVAPYAQSRLRLRYSHLPASEHNRIMEEVTTAWPISPELTELLEDQILMAEAAQETRDLIRILAAVFRVRGNDVPVLTSADFFVDDDSCGVQALLASIATAGEQEELLQIAQRNLENLQSQGVATSHSREIISSLWMRSMSPGRLTGGTRQDLQLDITRDAAVDDNAFLDELMRIKDNSVNIHGADDLQGRLWFGREENAKTKVRSTARNNRLWEIGGVPVGSAATAYPGKDIEHVRKTLCSILVPENRQSISQVIVLGPDWQREPWAAVDELERPSNWNKPVLLVVPTPFDPAEKVHGILGKWLADHVPAKRNTVRFLFQASGSKGIYDDSDLLFAARCSYLTSQVWKNDPLYRGLKDDFDRPLRESLRSRFDRFAVLSTWNYKQPDQCRFDVERIDGQLVRDKGSIPLAIDEQVKRDLFDPAAFQTLVIEYAKTNQEVSKLVDGLKEPPPSTSADAIPYLGDTTICEEILKVAAKGKVVLNVSGQWVGRLPDHADDDEALRFIRPRAFRSAQEMRLVVIILPAAAGSAAVTGPMPLPPQIVGPGTLFPPPTTGVTGAEGTTPPTTAGPTITPPTVTDGTSSELLTRSTPTATTVINLIGSFEQWGVPSDTKLDSAKLSFVGLTVQEVKQLLQKLPSSIRANLEVTYRKEGQP